MCFGILPINIILEYTDLWILSHRVFLRFEKSLFKVINSSTNNKSLKI